MIIAGIFSWVSIILNIVVAALGVYALILVIKALKIYINKNS